MIRALLKHEYELSVYAKNINYALPAEVAELDSKSGRLVLEVEYNGRNIDDYIRNGALNFDIEALKIPESDERETYSLSNVAARPLKTDSTTYRLDCQLPESVFVEETRGAIRIPFILGMAARVSLEVYLHELSVAGRLRNLSVGGCMVDIDIADSIAITVGQSLPGITLEFPDGERFFAEGHIRHMRPFGNRGHAAVGLEFINLTSPQAEALFHYVMEAEREAAYRAGINEKIDGHSPLFIPGTKEKKILRREEEDSRKRADRSPMQRGVLQISHQLQVALMYMKTRNLFPEEILYDCVDTLLYLRAQDRKALLYALACLRHEPNWVRHAIQVAGQLADMMLRRDPHAPQVREAILGTLLHTFGKPLLISKELPSLKAHMKPDQKKRLKTHAVVLRDKLRSLNWMPSPTCRDILENANERLDGSGYPAGKQGSQLSELVRLVSLLKIINKLTHERNGIPPREPLDAYRWIDETESSFDRAILVEYIQQYGLYPIGSLAKFSGGFLAWIMDINPKGMPIKVHVIKNLAFESANIDNVLSKNDFFQLGELDGIVDPDDYGIRITST
ncbi:putative metal dependent phosphohydrolase [Salinisphaera hydrothermalis C27AD]